MEFTHTEPTLRELVNDVDPIHAGAAARLCFNQWRHEHTNYDDLVGPARRAGKLPILVELVARKASRLYRPLTGAINEWMAAKAATVH